MRVWSPGARVGQAWLNVEAMKGTLVVGPPDATFGGKGIGMGTLGFTRGDVGNGGNERSSVVSPGMRRIVTFGIKGAFCIKYVNTDPTFTAANSHLFATNSAVAHPQ